MSTHGVAEAAPACTVEVHDDDQHGDAMTSTPSPAAEALLREFEGAWRDDTPVFACCRRSVAV
ncbi:MAG: hypothetical protein M3276_00685, partial [Actinomycetota bacterium]|nr:hypothetical protein [Actinomycetota bacterium]